MKWAKEFISYVEQKCGALHDFVAFVQFKKREKHPWGYVNFSKVADFNLQPY